LSYAPTLTPVRFFPAPATSELYTLSLHDALPISGARPRRRRNVHGGTAHHHERLQHAHQGNRPHQRRLPGTGKTRSGSRRRTGLDRKSTRLNSSHVSISYAVFCLKKKNKTEKKNT